MTPQQGRSRERERLLEALLADGEGAGIADAFQTLSSLHKRSMAAGTNDVVLRFCNGTHSAVRVLWWDCGQEREYAVLQPGQAYNQSTYRNHAWRLRDVETGALLCEHAAGSSAATIRVDAGGGVHVAPGLCYDNGASLVPHERWGWWRVRSTALGLPVKAYDCVCETAVAQAAHTLECLLADVDASIVQLLRERGAELGIIGRKQVTTDIPTHAHLRGTVCEEGVRGWDDGTRGLGGNLNCPTTSVGEENVTMEDDRHYPAESILVHEFAHTVMDVGLHGHPLQDAIRKAYEQARAQGLHDASSYLMANASEYWAEGSQAWFDATIRTDVTSGMTCREAVKQRDPELAALLTTVWGDGPWRYPLTAPHPLGHTTWPLGSAAAAAAAAAAPWRAVGAAGSAHHPAGGATQLLQEEGGAVFAIDAAAAGVPLVASGSRRNSGPFAEPGCAGSGSPQPAHSGAAGAAQAKGGPWRGLLRLLDRRGRAGDSSTRL